MFDKVIPPTVELFIWIGRLLSGRLKWSLVVLIVFSLVIEKHVCADITCCSTVLKGLLTSVRSNSSQVHQKLTDESHESSAATGDQDKKRKSEGPQTQRFPHFGAFDVVPEEGLHVMVPQPHDDLPLPEIEDTSFLKTPDDFVENVAVSGVLLEANSDQVVQQRLLHESQSSPVRFAQPLCLRDEARHGLDEDSVLPSPDFAVHVVIHVQLESLNKFEHGTVLYSLGFFHQNGDFAAPTDVFADQVRERVY